MEGKKTLAGSMKGRQVGRMWKKTDRLAEYKNKIQIGRVKEIQTRLEFLLKLIGVCEAKPPALLLLHRSPPPARLR